MGGVSDGRLKVTEEGTLEFSGTLSLENNGGFASVRSKPAEFNIKAGDAIVVRVKGDGREYVLNLYTMSRQMAFSYRAPLPTEQNEWTEVSVPLADFIATAFGRRVQGMGPVELFATELQRLTAHLAERLTRLHDAQPKVVRDSAVENLRDFFGQFRRLNIRSTPEMDALVEQAQQTITGIEPQTLRDSNRLRQMVARDFEQIQASVAELIVDRPQRNILRRGGVGGAA
jgi:hypothetical protein